ncbi:MFS transporter [Demequina sp. NBRC 110057]|uniref:MFS transporter n=1 Tax=Demequina sp. NBRC 110057 TaxID=1570346 RepID=UPI000A0228BC|nr:MFS transporter [Demequina sp. NBRC 110057]
MSTEPYPDQERTAPESGDTMTDTLEMSVVDLAQALAEDPEGFLDRDNAATAELPSADGDVEPEAATGPLEWAAGVLGWGGESDDAEADDEYAATVFTEADAQRVEEILEAEDALLATAEDAAADEPDSPMDVPRDAVPGDEAPGVDGAGVEGAGAEGATSDPVAYDYDAYEPATYDAEPTTVAVPIVGGTTEAVLLEEPVPGTRDEAALTLTPRRAKIALTVLAVAAFAAGVNEGAVVALTSAIASGLSVSVESVGLLATAFALTVVVAAVPLTLATKRMSRKVALTSALGVWTAGVTIAATAGSIEMLAVGRVVTAGAHALFWAMVAPMAASLFAPHLRARSVTGIMMGSAAAGVAGTPVVTTLGTQLGWQVPFYALAVLGVGLTFAMAFALPGSRGGTSTAAVLGDIPHRGAFFRVLTVAFLVSVAMSTTWTYVVPFYTEVAGISISMVPVMFALGGTLAVGATFAIGNVLGRHAVRTVAVGGAIMGLGWVAFMVGTAWAAIAGQICLSVGWAVLVAALLNWAMRHAPWRTEIAGGVYTSTANAGSALGPLLGAAIAGAFSTAILPWVSLALTIVAGVVIATVDRRTLAALAVPRQVRMARRNLVEVQQRRREWRVQRKELARLDREEAVWYRIEAQRRMDTVPREIALDRSLLMR